ncbi:MAG: YkgJ family cysteine cluster protein [Candidatus Woesearchaeota archaeon]
MVKKQTPRETILELGKECRNCGRCCQYTSGYVLPADIRPIAEYLGITEEELKDRYLEEVDVFNTALYKPKTKKPYGPCVFYEKGCSIHAVKPFHCRIGTCSKHGKAITEWFYLNYCVTDNISSLRQWAARVKVIPTIEGGRIDELVTTDLKKKIQGE